MSVAVLIPVGGADEHRARATQFVQVYYRRLFPWQVYLVEGADKGKGEVLNAAVEALPDHVNVLLLNDGDSLVMGHQAARAARLAAEDPGVVFAYTRYRRIDKETTERLSSPFAVFAVDDDQVEWEKLDAGSHGCVAIQRACWEQVGGIDPAFGMNGYEDLAFNTVCEAFWPSRRVSGDLYHLWHPRGWDCDSEAEATNRDRYQQYLARWGDRAALLELRYGTVAA